ncbi:MAG TPA: UPF0182 family protein [Gemmatimonadaceae bacterium]|nr:UPF0182 family protein [Gemmatimonadaceae bacterium]
MSFRRWMLLALAATALLLLAARAVAQVYVDYQWYLAAGAAEVWRARVAAVFSLRICSGLASGAFIFANLYAVRHSVVSLVLPRRVANLEIGEEVPTRYLTFIALAVAVVLGALLSLPQDDWSTLLLARIGEPFGESDPYFGADLGFFVYWLPLEQELYYWSLICIFIVTAMVVFLYALTPSLRWDRGRLYVSGYVRRHLTVLAAVVLLLLAWSFRLDMYEALTAGSGAGGAFAYVDHKVLIPGNLVLAITALGAALIVAWAGASGQGRLAAWAILGMIVMAVVVRVLVPFAVERMADETRARIREQPYLATRGAYTRRAYAADRVIPADASSGYASPSDAARGMAIWDGPAVARSVETLRSADVLGTSIAWRATPAGVTADVVARPATAGGDTARAIFLVSHVLASTADARGGLARLASTRGEGEESPLPPAVVFPGARGYLVLADTLNRLAGSPLGTAIARIAHALSLQHLAWLSGELPRPRPTLMDHRDVRERLQMLVPFFAQGSTIAPLVAGDSLFWAVDLYAASSFYPLSRRLQLSGEERSYYQHAATALVRAATGEVLLVADPDSTLDPIARSWMHRFPSLFGPASTLPGALLDALPPATDGLRAQALAFGQYGGTTGTDVERRPPARDGSDSALAAAEPRFVLPGSSSIATSVVLVDSLDRVGGIVIGSGGPRRGTRWFAAPDHAPTWSAVLDSLATGDSATTPAPVTAFAHGVVQVVPIAGTLAFVQSAYLWHAQASPLLAHVSLFYLDSTRTGPTLETIAGVPLTPPHEAAPLAGDLRARAAVLYDRMRDALRRGDWTAFGDAFDSLGTLLSRRPR